MPEFGVRVARSTGQGRQVLETVPFDVPSDSPTEILVQRRTVPLTDDQIKALPTTAVEIVPAIGPGKMVLVISALFVLDHRAAVYSNADNGGTSGPTLGYNGGSWYFSGAGWLFSDNNSGASKAVSTFGLGDFFTPKVIGINQYLDDVNGTPLMMYYPNGSPSQGDLDGGDPANTMTVTVLYLAVDV